MLSDTAQIRQEPYGADYIYISVDTPFMPALKLIVQSAIPAGR